MAACTVPARLFLKCKNDASDVNGGSAVTHQRSGGGSEATHQSDAPFVPGLNTAGVPGTHCGFTSGVQKPGVK